VQFAKTLTGKKRAELVASKMVAGNRVALYLSDKSPMARRSLEVMARAAVLARSPAFQKRVIQKLIAPEPQAAYFRSEHWARLTSEANLASP
jgi:hypothetical protein